MIELGVLCLKTPEAFVEARRKIVRLTGALGCSEIIASRLATIFSELLRLGRGSRAGVRVVVSIENRNGEHGLSFELAYGEKVSPAPGAALFFDAFETAGADGAPTTISAFSRLPNHDFAPSSDLIDSIKRMLALPSRSELMKDLQEKNRDLKESAEQIQAARDAAEKASESLEQRVAELAGARFAMLNIMEDLGEANKELETAHRQILDSIRYASRIQRAVLPGESVMKRAFPEHMVIWEPRDVVGGDIYWRRSWGEGSLLILGDCTGHGVPGAFMTLVANGALDLAMLRAAPGDPADLIGHMHRLMQAWLGQDSDEGDSDDGIELGACYLPPERTGLVFSGARFTLFHFDGEGEVQEVAGDKKGIGYRGVPHDMSFTNRHVAAPPVRRFYLTTDGMIDQVGGERRRGFGKKRFARLIASLAATPFHEQGKRFMEALSRHQGEEIRRDDVSVIGFRLG